jgi:hypothetical protein
MSPSQFVNIPTKFQAAMHISITKRRGECAMFGVFENTVQIILSMILRN